MITVEQARTKLDALVGQKAWGVALGEGSFVTLEFGQPVTREGRKTHGDWHVWVYGCAWRVDGPDGIASGSADERDAMAQAIQPIDGRALTAFEIDESLEATLRFGDLRLRLFPAGTAMDHWMVFTPDGRVITAGPGSQIVDELA